MNTAIGIGGYPGAGKTTLSNLFDERKALVIHDFNIDWNGNTSRALEAISQGRSVVVNDVMFVNASWRRKLEEALCRQVQWLVFENAPEKARRNAVARNRNSLKRELELIDWLSEHYSHEPLKILD